MLNNEEIKSYGSITTVLLLSFIINICVIIILNVNVVQTYINCIFNELGTELIKQFFYGALGATVAGTLFLAKDKDINEIESLKSKPDPLILRHPDRIDKTFYLLRIMTSGVLAIVGTMLILSGFTYLEVVYEDGFTLKHKLLFAISSGLIGLYQFKFLNTAEKIMDSFFKIK